MNSLGASLVTDHAANQIDYGVLCCCSGTLVLYSIAKMHPANISNLIIYCTRIDVPYQQV